MKQKRVYAIALALAMAVTSLPGVNVAAADPSNVDRTGAGELVIDEAPPVPSITRYSTSRWDASWFRMETDLQVGKDVYTIDPDPTKGDVNAYPKDDYKIAEMPDFLKGSDYILNYINGQPDQNHHFYAEQDIDIYAAIDADKTNVPGSVSGFTRTEGTVKLNNGKEFWLAKRSYPAGLVTLNKYNESGYNVFYMVLPTEGKAVSNALTHNEVVAEGTKPAKNAADEKYQYYLNSVFNYKGKETVPDVPEGYTGRNVSLFEPEGEDLNRYVVIEGNGELTKDFDTPITGKVIYEGKVKTSDDNIEMSIPVMKSSDRKTAIELFFDADGKIKAGDTEVAEYEKDTWYTIRMLIDIDNGTYEVWIDHIRKVQDVPFSNPAAKNIQSIEWTSGRGTLDLDNVRLYDNTEIYEVEDDFNDGTIPAEWTVPTTAAIANVPFVSDKSLKIQNEGRKAEAKREFGPLTGDVTIQTKVKPMENGWVNVPVVYDSKGDVVLKIAAYRNSFFASDGNNWAYICSSPDEALSHNYYPAANWYTVKVVLNTYTNRYDLYIDGAKRRSGLSFVTDAEDVASISYTAEEENVLYVDQVRVFDSASLARGLMPKEDVFDVRDYGAKGDGVTDDTEAIKAALEDAEYTGGTVLLENGTFYCGQIDMRNDETLFIDASAKIFSDNNRNHYTHFQPKINGIVGYNGNHQLGAGVVASYQTENFRILGGGTLDCNGFFGRNENDPGNQRPCAMYLTQSRDMYIENIDIVRSPHWTLVPYESFNLTVRNVSITNHIAPNRDGIDPVNTSNMTVENCFVIAGDDAFCPKSGNALPSVNVDVRNTTMQSYCNGVKFGTDAYDDFINYNIEDCTIKNVGLSGITLQAADGSNIENIVLRRIDMNDVDNSFAFMVGNRARANSGLPKKLGHIDNVVVEDVNFTNPMEPPFSHQNEQIHAGLLVGLNPNNNNGIDNGTHRITNVSFTNVYQEMPGGYDRVPGQPGGINGGYPEHSAMGDSVGWAYTMRWADNVTFTNCRNVLFNNDARKEYSFADYTGEDVTKDDGKIHYGIVFEENEDKLDGLALSGVIEKDQSAEAISSVLYYELKQDPYYFKIDEQFEGAIVKCDKNGDVTLWNAEGTEEIAEAVVEEFANEEGTRPVFHLSGLKPEAELTNAAADAEIIVNSSQGYYPDDVWEALQSAYEDAVEVLEAGNATEDTILKYNKALKQAIAEANAVTDARDALNTAVKNAETIVNGGQESYLSVTWNALKAAYDDAVKALNGKETAERLENLKKALEDAKNDLKPAEKPPVEDPQPALKAGDVLVDSLGTYQVVDAAGKTAKLVSVNDKKAASLSVPAIVKIKGVDCTIVEIGSNLMSGNTKLKKLTIGSNVTTIGDKAFFKCTALTKVTIPASVNKIGKQAFNNCKKLKTITIKTTKLTTKNVGKNAFKGIVAKATIKVPKAKLNAYKKLLKSKGVGSKAKIKK